MLVAFSFSSDIDSHPPIDDADVMRNTWNLGPVTRTDLVEVVGIADRIHQINVRAKYEGLYHAWLFAAMILAVDNL